MRIACCSEFILRLYSPVDFAQERQVFERNRSALQNCTSYNEGSNDSLMNKIHRKIQVFSVTSDGLSNC